MAPHDIEIIRVAQEVIDLLTVVLAVLRNRPEVAAERVEVSIELLMNLFS